MKLATWPAMRVDHWDKSNQIKPKLDVIGVDHREVNMKSNESKAPRGAGERQGSLPAPRNNGGDFAFHCAWIRETLARLRQDHADTPARPPRMRHTQGR